MGPVSVVAAMGVVERCSQWKRLGQRIPGVEHNVVVAVVRDGGEASWSRCITRARRRLRGRRAKSQVCANRVIPAHTTLIGRKLTPYRAGPAAGKQRAGRRTLTTGMLLSSEPTQTYCAEPLADILRLEDRLPSYRRPVVASGSKWDCVRAVPRRTPAAFSSSPNVKLRLSRFDACSRRACPRRRPSRRTGRWGRRGGPVDKSWG